MTKKDVFLAITFIVAPMGIFAAGVYYGPKIKKWYAGYSQKKIDSAAPGSPGDEPIINSDLVKIKNIDSEAKTITLSLNNTPDITFSYKTGGAPLVQIVNIPGLESNEIALRYIDGKFSVTDGSTKLFEQQIETPTT